MERKQFAKEWLYLVALVAATLLVDRYGQGQMIEAAKTVLWVFLGVYAVLMTLWAIRTLRSGDDEQDSRGKGGIFSWLFAIVLAFFLIWALMMVSDRMPVSSASHVPSDTEKTELSGAPGPEEEKPSAAVSSDDGDTAILYLEKDGKAADTRKTSD